MKPIGWLFLAFLASGCSEELEPKSYSTGDHDRFFESIETYPYEADPAKRARVLSGFKELQVGMEMQEVRKSLGEPDGVGRAYARASEEDVLRYTDFAYYLYREELELAQPDDEVVFVHFTPDGLLYWAYTGDLPNLTQIGGFQIESEP